MAFIHTGQKKGKRSPLKVREQEIDGKESYLVLQAIVAHFFGGGGEPSDIQYPWVVTVVKLGEEKEQILAQKAIHLKGGKRKGGESSGKGFIVYKRETLGVQSRGSETKKGHRVFTRIESKDQT